MSEQQQKQFRQAAVQDTSAATTEAFKVQQRIQWFSCQSTQFTEQNNLVLRRSVDDRPTNIDENIQNGFTLMQYACVFDNIAILQMIYKHEKDSLVPLDTQIFKNNTMLKIPANSTPLQLAILCNSTKCTEYLLKDLTLSDVRIPLNNLSETTSLVCARLPEYKAAQIALQYTLLQTKEFFYETEASKNIVDVACEHKNEFLMHLFTKLLASPNAIYLQKFALKCKTETSSECTNYLTVLQTSALEKIRIENLYQSEEWKALLQVYFGQQFDQKYELLTKTQQEKEEAEKLADEYRSVPPQIVQKQQKNSITPTSQQKHQISNKPVYDLEGKSTQEVSCKPFELQAQQVEVKVIEEVEDVYQQAAEVPQDEKFNLFDNKPENQIPILISQYSNTFQISRPEQLAAARNFAADDRVVPLTQAQVNWFNVCRDGNLQLCSSMIRTHVNEVDTRATDPEKLIYNGFTAIHYAVAFGRWQIVESLLIYEALSTTKARVILKAPGIGPDRAIVVPLQSNALQLACYCNQTQIIKLIVDSLIQPKKQMIDPIQVAFSENKPLSQQQQKKILTLKNELEQTALAVLAQCRISSNELCKNLQKEDYILQLCLDQLESGDILAFNDQFVVQNAYLFNNVHILHTLRTELLTNPCKKIPQNQYAALLYSIYDLILDLQGGNESHEVLESITIKDDIKKEIDILMKQIEAQHYVGREQEDQDAQKPEHQLSEHLPEEKRFKKHFYETFKQYDTKLQESANDVNKQLNFLKSPDYIESFENSAFVQKKLIEKEQGDLEYLNSVVQAQDLSYYFDCVILGYKEFVIQESCNYIKQIDRRQTNKQIINGFTGLLYACYYGHLDIVKSLLEQEFDVRQGFQIKVQTEAKQVYVFNEVINCYQAAILSKSANSNSIIDYITQIAQANQQIAVTLFLNHKQSSDIFKLAIIHKKPYILANQLVRLYETQHVYKQLQEKPLTPTILWTICEQRSIDGIKFIQDIILQDSIATRAKDTDMPQETKQHIESELLFSLQLACLQRIDGKCPLDLIKTVVVPASGILPEFTKLSPQQQKENAQLSVAIKLVNDLTNDAVMRALTAQFDDLAQKILTAYFGDELPNIQSRFEEKGDYLLGKVVHRIEPATTEQLERTNFFVQDYQINRITFQPIQKLNEIDIWFEMCKYGTLQQVQGLARNFIGRRELRYNNYDLSIHQGFTGLMYAILFNSLDVILFLMDHEAMYNLEQEAVIKTKTGPYYIHVDATPLHIAAIAGEQYVIDAFFQFFFEHEFDIITSISVSRFLIIHNKRVHRDQLMKDFAIDQSLLRLAVQYARVEFLNTMGEMSTTQEYFEYFSQQLFNMFDFNGYEMNCNDLIWQLPSQKYAALNKADVNNTITFVELALKKVLITLMQQNRLGDAAGLINPFYKSQDATDKIQTSYKILSDPEVINEDEVEKVAKEQFFRIEDSQILPQKDIIQLQMQSDLTDEWFRACRDNDMQFIHTNFKQMKMQRDGRQSSYINKVHTGFCGLHYALVYQAQDAFSFLFDFEWNVITGSDAIINGDQGRYYVPARSTILHLIAICRCNRFINTMRVKPQVENLINTKNKLNVSPIELFSGQNYCDSYLFDIFLFNFNDSEMRLEAEQIIKVCFENCCSEKANNVDFAKFSVQNYNLYEALIFKHVFQLQKLEEQTQASKEFLKLKDEALEFALLYRMEDQWRRTLDEHYGDKRVEVEEEYQNLKILQAEQYELVEDEKMFEEPELIVTEQQNITKPPTLKYLRESKMTREELNWFDACRHGDVKYVQQHIKLAGIQDQCITNYQEKRYTQFTGLMYAIVYGQLGIVKTLIKQELLIYSKAKNLIEVPNDNQNDIPQSDGIEKCYYLMRTAFPVLLAVVCHQYEIFNYFIQELKTQEELIFNQYIYEQMVACEFSIPYSYMSKLMSMTYFNLVQLAYIFRKDNHMRYLLNFLVDQNDKTAKDGKRSKQDLLFVKQSKFDEILYKQQLSVLNKNNIVQWSDLGENTSTLIDKSIEFGFNTSYDSEIMQYLSNIYEEETIPRIKEFRNKKYHSDLVVNMDQIVHNCYVINDSENQTSKEIVSGNGYSVNMEETEDPVLKQQQQAATVLGEYLDYVKDNNLVAAKRKLIENSCKNEKRPYDLQQSVFTGFCALHYACYFNNIPLIGVLWNQEKQCLTQCDVIIEALGTGFGNQYLLSKNSNALHIALLQDNQEAVQMIINLLAQDKDLQELYQKPNCRGQNTLYFASICWRCNAAQHAFKSKMLQTYMRQIVLHKDPLCIEVIQALIYSNCSYGAKILIDWSHQDLQFKQWFYQVVMKSDYTVMRHKHEKQTFGTESDKQFIALWLDQIYEDALNFALKQNAEINWNRMLEENLGAQLKSLVVKQFTLYRSITVTGGQIEIYDDLLQKQTVEKVKAKEQQSMLSGNTLSKTYNITQPGRFNKSLNVTTLEDIGGLKLPQQEIIAKPQIVLKSPPQVLGGQNQPAKEDSKNEKIEKLWIDIQDGK